MRKSFLLGLVFGVPFGMLVADLLAARSRRRWERRAREWTVVGRAKAAEMADHAVRAAEDQIRHVPAAGGDPGGLPDCSSRSA